MMLFLTRKASAAPSASVAIGTAMAFVLTSATIALIADRGASETVTGRGWTLRGAVAPIDGPSIDPPRRSGAFGGGRLA